MTHTQEGGVCGTLKYRARLHQHVHNRYYQCVIHNLFFHWYSRRIDNEYICRAYVLYSRCALTSRVVARRCEAPTCYRSVGPSANEHLGFCRWNRYGVKHLNHACVTEKYLNTARTHSGITTLRITIVPRINNYLWSLIDS